MAAINLDAVLKKVVACSHTNAGKAKMREVIQRYKANGTGRTAAGDKIVTEADMQAAASKMIDVLRSTARSYGLPASVMRHFDSLECSKIHEMPDGSSVIYIYFGDDLHRDSLYSDGYDGVRNIVALLNNGYHARNYVYGDWAGHSPTGESGFDGRSVGTSAYIRSRKDREGLHFIQKAIQDFNGNYGAEFHVAAVAGDDYE